MDLYPEFVDLVRNRKLVFDCFKIELRQNRSEKPALFRGPGSVWQTPSGGIKFKIYSTGVENHDPETIASKPGLLMPPEALFSLRFWDAASNEWNADNIRPVIYQHGSDTFVRGNLHSLSTSKKSVFPENPQQFYFYFMHGFHFPRTTKTSSSRTLEGTLIGGGFARDGAKFIAQQCEFNLYDEGPTTRLRVFSDIHRPMIFQSRIIEALEFVLARSLQWQLLESESHGDHTVTILANRGTETLPRLHPPIAYESHYFSQPVWSLFNKYLGYIAEHEMSDRLHPCSEQLFAVRETSSSTLPSQALGLSVALEGMVKTLFGKAPKTSKGLKAAIKNLEAYVTAWPGVEGLAEMESLRGRLPGLLNQLNMVRPKDVLNRLVTDNVTDASHVDAWSDLRNSAAHAADVESSKFQDLINRISASTVLLYHMIFHAIGYQGPYTDWSTYGYPIRDYPSRDILPKDHTPEAEELITSMRLPSSQAPESDEP